MCFRKISFKDSETVKSQDKAVRKESIIQFAEATELMEQERRSKELEKEYKLFGRIDWKRASCFLTICWAICIMDNTILSAIAWTAIIVIYDLFICVINRLIKNKRVK